MDASPRPLPRWLIQGLIALVIVLLLALSVSVPALFRPEPFAQWESLGGPPGGAQHIIDVGAERPYGIERIFASANDAAIWVRGDNGLVYTRRIQCGSDANCASWRPVVSVPRLAPPPEGLLTRTADCAHIDGNAGLPALAFAVSECTHAAFPGNDVRRDTFVAIMANGNLMEADGIAAGYPGTQRWSLQVAAVVVEILGVVLILLILFLRRSKVSSEH